MGVIVTIPFGDMMHQNDRARSQAFYKQCLLNPAWWEERAEIMRRFVMPSLQAATADVTVLATFRPETMKLARPVLDVLRPVDAVTYVGDRDEALVKIFLPEDVLVVAHLDSDDLYHPLALAEMEHACRQEGSVAVLRDGYYLDINDGRMAEVRMPGPPFFAAAYTRDALKDLESLHAYRLRWHQKYHHQMQNCERTSVIEGHRYMQTIHGTNTSTSWDNPHTKNKIVRFVEEPGTVDAILGVFGVEASFAAQ